jgi:hypothetical protein
VSNAAAFELTEADVQWSAVRSQGPGGQNVNKVASAVHLRFDVRASRLPADVQQRLLALGDSRITTDGVVVIKAQNTALRSTTCGMGCSASMRWWPRLPGRHARASPPSRPGARSKDACRAKACAPASRLCAAGCMTELV